MTSLGGEVTVPVGLASLNTALTVRRTIRGSAHHTPDPLIMRHDCYVLYIVISTMSYIQLVIFLSII